MARKRLKKIISIGNDRLSFYTIDDGEPEEIKSEAEPKVKPKVKRKMTPQEENSRKTIPQGEQLRMVFDYTLE